LFLLVALLTASMTVAAEESFEAQRARWNAPAPPFRIIGNVSYVGTTEIGAYLISGPEGHVLIDGGMEESAPRIAANIRQLGFAIEDIRYILVNHGHWDHAGGVAELQRLSEARVVAGVADTADLISGLNARRRDTARFPPVRVDKAVIDGDLIEVGPIRLRAHSTPGHTPGCTSWTLGIRDGDRDLDILFACSLTVAGQRLIGDAGYPNAAADFEASFARLRSLRADVFLGFHAGHFGLEDKRRRLRDGDPQAFIDPDELARQIDRAEAAYQQALADERSRQRR
jgi:metallo-beta-lactamase class B